MPFTFAHPAAVLWSPDERRWGLPLSALVIGSMSPDFEYLLRLQTVSLYSHAFTGLLTFCLPSGLLVYGIYHRFVAAALVEHLPRYVRVRLQPAGPVVAQAGGLSMWLGVCAALLFGALTHIVWDAFTHGNGLVVCSMPVLAEPVGGFPVYRYLQHGSTLAGFITIGYWFHHRPEVRAEAETQLCRGYWAVAFAAGILTWCALWALAPTSGFVTGVVLCMDALFVALLSGGVWFSVCRARRNAGDLAV
jgi:hypothetical protein